MLWYDLKYLLDEGAEADRPEVHVEIDYTVRDFKEVEREYLELFRLLFAAML